MIKEISIVGAGTMGSGIALAAALKNYKVILCDINKNVLESAKVSIGKNLQVLEQRKKISAEEKLQIHQSIVFTSSIEDCVASVVIEAIVEKIEVKENLFCQLASINSTDTILASNTSSLSITRIQKNIPFPQRVAGLHFFNPAPIMKLVEVVKGNDTSDATANILMDLCRQMDKIPVLCKDMPGFIVNRIARHYYLEAMHLVQNNLATIESVDAAMEAIGFKMGPFSLMDLIGMDVNLAVSTSLYEAFGHAERFKPSALQIEKVQKGELGKKTGIGFYAYNKPV
jgi:3-hydroxybutyryl-CoA dehydrogenase